MGPPESPTNPLQNQATTSRRPRRGPRRRPRRRYCLLNGCQQRFRPQRARQRYCSDRCREAARRWSLWKAQHRYRRTSAGQQKRNGQSRRYRERVGDPKTSGAEAVAGAARVITKNFFFDHFCDRPGCYEGFVLSRRSPCQRFCSKECRHALERVWKRERRWKEARSDQKGQPRGEVSRRGECPQSAAPRSFPRIDGGVRLT